MSKVENKKLPFQTKKECLFCSCWATPSKQRLYFYSGTNKFLSVVVYATIGYDKRQKPY